MDERVEGSGLDVPRDSSSIEALRQELVQARPELDELWAAEVLDLLEDVEDFLAEVGTGRADFVHRWWCTDHVDGNADGWSDCQVDVCQTIVSVTDWVHVCVQQEPGQAVPDVVVQATDKALTPEQAGELNRVLLDLLDRIVHPGAESGGAQ